MDHIFNSEAMTRNQTIRSLPVSQAWGPLLDAIAFLASRADFDKGALFEIKLPGVPHPQFDNLKSHGPVAFIKDGAVTENPFLWLRSSTGQNLQIEWDGQRKSGLCRMMLSADHPDLAEAAFFDAQEDWMAAHRAVKKLADWARGACPPARRAELPEDDLLEMIHQADPLRETGYGHFPFPDLPAAEGRLHLWSDASSLEDVFLAARPLGPGTERLTDYIDMLAGAGTSFGGHFKLKLPAAGEKPVVAIESRNGGTVRLFLTQAQDVPEIRMVSASGGAEFTQYRRPQGDDAEQQILIEQLMSWAMKEWPRGQREDFMLSLDIGETLIADRSRGRGEKWVSLLPPELRGP